MLFHRLTYSGCEHPSVTVYLFQLDHEVAHSLAWPSSKDVTIARIAQLGRKLRTNEANVEVCARKFRLGNLNAFRDCDLILQNVMHLALLGLRIDTNGSNLKTRYHCCTHLLLQ